MASAQDGLEQIYCNDAKNEVVFRIPGFSNFGVGYHTIVQEHAFQNLRKRVRATQNWLLRLLPLHDSKFETEDSLRKSIAASASSRPLQTEVIQICTGNEDEFSMEHEEKLNELLLSWSDIRETVLDGAFRQFQSRRQQRLETARKDPGFYVIFPETQTHSEIEDLFSISQMEISLDGKTRFSGPCLWDDEHGFEFDLDLNQDVEQ